MSLTLWKKPCYHFTAPYICRKADIGFPKPTRYWETKLHACQIILNSKYKQKELQKDLACLPLVHTNKTEKVLTGCIQGQAPISGSQGGQYLPFPFTQLSERAGCWKQAREHCYGTHSAALSQYIQALHCPSVRNSSPSPTRDNSAVTSRINQMKTLQIKNKLLVS